MTLQGGICPSLGVTLAVALFCFSTLARVYQPLHWFDLRLGSPCTDSEIGPDTWLLAQKHKLGTWPEGEAPSMRL